MSNDKTFESIMEEKRRFAPPKELSAQAYIGSMEEYKELYEESIRDPKAFWEQKAKEEIEWFSTWESVFDWGVDDARLSREAKTHP